MADLAPFNVNLIDPDEYIKRKDCFPVTVHAMYESSTDRFHPDGLFSEIIFGQLGSRERLIRRGYIDLHTEVITPHLYKQLVTLKSYYKDILAGKQYAYFDKELKDLVRTDANDPNGETGYAFFISCLPKIKFATTESYQRNDKIKLIEKYKDKLLISKYIVLPAGVRDVKIKDGRPESEKINKLYLALLSLAQSLPLSGSDDPIYDAYRFQIQNKVVEIYDYINAIVSGKGGFAQAKYARRSIVYAARNVITAGIISAPASSDAPNAFRITDLQLPLLQGMKEITPLVVHWMQKLFFQHIFQPGITTVPLLHPRTFNLEYHEIDDQELKRFTTGDGIEDIINDFRDPSIHFKPVSVKLKTPVKYQDETLEEFYLWLVYDLGDNIQLYRDWDQIRKNPSRYTNMFRAPHKLVETLQAYEPSTYILNGTCALYAMGMDIEPQDLDVIFNPTLWNHFKQLAVEQHLQPDEFGDYEIVIDGVEVHTKNSTFHIFTDKEYEEYKSTKAITIEGYQYTAPIELHRVYHEIARVKGRLKDKRKIEFLDKIIVDETNLRPLTYVEMCYMAAFYAARGKYFTATRYPILNLYNQQVYHGHIMSTDPGRVVRLAVNESIVFPEYPRMDARVKSSMSIHPATLGHYEADHDGDAMSSMALVSEEAVKELDEYTNDNQSILTSDGKLVYGLDGGSKSVVVGFTLFYCSYHPLSNKK